MQDNGQRFIDLYKQLEDAIRKKYSKGRSGASPLVELARMPQFRYLKGDLDYCREVRNLLTHKPKVNGEYAVVPTDAMLDMMQGLLEKVVSPPKIFDYAVKRRDLYVARLEDRVADVLAVMYRKNYTHAPILTDGGAVWGVFSTNTIVQFIAGCGLESVHKDLTVGELRDFLPLEAHVGESFRFAKANAPLHEVKDIFERAYVSHERLALIFLTRGGGPADKLLGLLTPWAVLGIDVD